METNANLFNDSHIKEVIHQSMQAAYATETKRKQKQFRPDYARFKLKVYWCDGGSNIFYSYDFYKKHTAGQQYSVKNVTDEELGFMKLLKFIKSVNGKFVSAVIFCKLTNDLSTRLQDYDTEVAKFIKNRKGTYHPQLRFRKNKLDSALMV